MPWTDHTVKLTQDLCPQLFCVLHISADKHVWWERALESDSRQHPLWDWVQIEHYLHTESAPKIKSSTIQTIVWLEKKIILFEFLPLFSFLGKNIHDFFILNIANFFWIIIFNLIFV